MQSEQIGSVVYVTWLDSCASGGWQSPENATKATVCESIGWLIRKNEETVWIAGHKSESTEEWNGIMAIPRVSIQHLQVVPLRRGK